MSLVVVHSAKRISDDKKLSRAVILSEAKNLHAGIEMLQSQGPKTARPLLQHDMFSIYLTNTLFA